MKTAPTQEAPMRRTIIESPFAPPPGAQPEHRALWIELHTWYTRAAMADSLTRGEAPFASHALYTLPGVLDDDVPEERRRGMEAGFAWGEAADQVAVYVDLGVSRGMLEGCERAAAAELPREMRRVEGWRERLPGHLAAFLEALPEEALPCPLLDPPPWSTLTTEAAERLAELLEEREPPPWADLDPGIVPAVRLLWRAGFNPTDSGDGSKAETMECAVPFPHVYCRVPAPSLHREALRAAALDWGSIGMAAPRVEGSCSPGEPGFVMVMWPGDLHGLPADAAPAAPLDEALAADHNPFDPYRLQGCYGIPADVVPGLPWWRVLRDDSEADGWRRIDGPGAHCDFIEGAVLHGEPPGADDLEGDTERASFIAEALREYDTAVPLRRPTVLPGQVWARYIDPLATDAHPDSTRWFLQPIDFGRIRQDGGVEGGRDLTTHMADRGAVLVYGPGAPWAPPEWAPGKAWDGEVWVEVEEAPDGPA